jgi:GLPGLI family protein
MQLFGDRFSIYCQILKALLIKFTLIMKNLLLFLFLIVTEKNTYAQKSEPVVGVVSYIFYHQKDTLSKEYYKEEMGLFFGKFSSVYKSISGEKTDSVLRSKIEQQLKDGIPINLGNVNQYTKQNYYSFFNTGKVEIESPFLSNKYLFSDTIPLIIWEIKEQFKKIGGLQCQMATGFFGGRIYKVWFCPDIPFSSGPWKLSGLPGLILEAYDLKQQVKFIFNGISKNTNTNKVIALPKDAIITTRNKFQRMVKAFNENPNGYNNSDLDFKVKKVPGFINKSKFNNPLEIIEKH